MKGWFWEKCEISQFNIDESFVDLRDQIFKTSSYFPSDENPGLCFITQHSYLSSMDAHQRIKILNEVSFELVFKVINLEVFQV